MKKTLVTPVALLAVLSGAGAVNSVEDAPPAAAPEAVTPPACLPDASAGPDSDERRYDAFILHHAQKRRLNPRLVKAIIAAESQFTPGAVSRCGALGLMQVMPATAEELGVKACELSDPETNIAAGTEYLAWLFKTARRRPGAEEALVVRRVIAAYHSGPSALDAEVWSEATRRYVRTVLGCYRATSSVVRPARPGGDAVASIFVPKEARERIW